MTNHEVAVTCTQTGRTARRLLICSGIAPVVFLAYGCGKPGANARLPGAREPQASAFYIGMPSSEALATLPPGYKLSALGTFYEYGPNGPSDYELAHEEWYAIQREDYSEGVPLFFNQEKRLVRIGASFDESRFVLRHATPAAPPPEHTNP